jgi:hypothetical protein
MRTHACPVAPSNAEVKRARARPVRRTASDRRRCPEVFGTNSEEVPHGRGG